MARKQRLGIRLAALAIGLLLFLAAGELLAALGLWWLGPSSQSGEGIAPPSVWKSRDENHPRQKPWYRYRIVCLGDSCTYGIGLERPQSYPAQLEALLNQQAGFERFEVINLGLAGSTSSQGLWRLRQLALQFQPDLLIVSYGLNDKWRSELADSTRLAQESSFHIRLLSGLRSLLSHSHLFQLLRRGLEPGLQQYRRNSTLSIDYRVPLPEFHQNLTTMVREGKAAGAEVLLLTMSENPVMERLTREGVEAYEQGRFDEAVLKLERCVNISFLYQPRPEYYLSLAYRALGKIPQADEALRSSRQLAKAFPFPRKLSVHLGNVSVRSHLDGIELQPQDWVDIYARYRATTAQVASEEAVPHLDMTGRGLRPTQFTDYCHLVGSGYANVAQAIIETMGPRLKQGQPPRP